MITLNDSKIILLGFGISNSKIASHLCALGHGDKITVRDKKPEAEFGDNIAHFSYYGVRFICGCEPTIGLLDSEDMSDTLIFRTPGMRPDSGDIPEAVRRGAKLSSEIEYVLENSKAAIFGITGSDGKTTTSTLTHLLLQNSHTSGTVYLGGNIGTPLFALADTMTERDLAVLELSSFQLMTVKCAPRRAAITNISPNHLDWHTGMDEYAEAKYNICGDGTELLVLNGANVLSRRRAAGFDGKVIFFSAYRDNYASLCADRKNASAIFLRDGKIIFSDGENETEVLEVSKIKLPGMHNIENYMTAIALTWGYVPLDVIRKVAETFGGVEHRLEFVREKDGVKFYNSSIDSSPTRTMAALSILAHCRPVLILCGRDKGTPFDKLANMLHTSASAVVVSGEAAPKILTAINTAAEDHPDSSLIVRYEEDFDTAVTLAASLANPGSAVLLSPSCTSFDKFRNFEARGEHFKALVNSL